MAAPKPAFSLRDLESGAKNLHSVSPPSSGHKDEKKAGDSDEQALRTLGNN